MSAIKMEVWPDVLRNSDKRSLLRLKPNESREVTDTFQIDAETTLVRAKVRNEVWTWEGDPMFPDGLMFDVRNIKNAIARAQVPYEVLRIEINEAMYDHTLRNCDAAHVATRTEDDMKQIAVAVFMPSETLLLIDGNHRLAARYQAGLRDVRVAVVEFAAITQFIHRPIKMENTDGNANGNAGVDDAGGAAGR